jgi:hypothetical protein
MSDTNFSGRLASGGYRLPVLPSGDARQTRVLLLAGAVALGAFAVAFAVAFAIGVGASTSRPPVVALAPAGSPTTGKVSVVAVGAIPAPPALRLAPRRRPVARHVRHAAAPAAATTHAAPPVTPVAPANSFSAPSVAPAASAPLPSSAPVVSSPALPSTPVASAPAGSGISSGGSGGSPRGTGTVVGGG